MNFLNLEFESNYTSAAALNVSRIQKNKIFFTKDGDIIYKGVKYTKNPSELKFEDLSEDFLNKLVTYVKERA